MVVDLLVESFAERNDIWERFAVAVLAVGVEPQGHPVEKMKSRPFNRRGLLKLVFGPEKDRGGEDPFETLYGTSIMRTISGKAKEIQHLASALEMYLAALLRDCKRRNPNGYQAVLAEW